MAKQPNGRRNGSVGGKKTTIQLALPIKTQSGHLLKNIRQEEEEEVKEEQVAKVKAPIVVEVAQEEKPKSLVEQLKEKQDTFNKIKEKVAYHSRDIIENPQREVSLNRLQHIRCHRKVLPIRPGLDPK